tara:strand:+ start:278 stop:934 length:657 start_codon:yes stop_codon:yes gene_type:complete
MINVKIKKEIKRYFRRYFLHYLAKIKFYKDYNIQFPKSVPFKHIDYIDLNNLIEIIKIHKPKIVLELGSGYSTYAIIYALNEAHKSNDFEFFSVDQTKEYQETLIRDFPEKYKKQINFMHRKIYVKKFKNQKMSFFENLPNSKFDFIYEDRMDHKDALIAGDVIKYEHDIIKNHDNFIFTIDGMFSTCDFYKKNLIYNYEFDISSFTGINFIKTNTIK